MSRGAVSKTAPAMIPAASALGKTALTMSRARAPIVGSETTAVISNSSGAPTSHA